MPNKYKNITALIVKKIDNEISPAELEKLEAWAAGSLSRQRLLKELEDEERILRESAAFHEWDWRVGWNEMVAGESDLHGVLEEETAASGDISEAEMDPAKEDEEAADEEGDRLRGGRVSGNILRRYPAVWAAASIVLVAGGIFLWRSFNTDEAGTSVVSGEARGPGLKEMPRGQPTHAPPLNATPGGWKATLRLTDERVVDLGASPLGVVGVQGAASIYKQSDSAIAYAVGGGATAVGGFNEVSTPRGGQFRVILPDGSKVWMSAATTLRFPPVFSGGSRDVQLDGEAFFEVRSLESAEFGKIPFVVHVGSLGDSSHERTQFEVTGTSFSVMAYRDDGIVRAILVVGAIKVHEAAGVRRKESLLVMHPGYQYEREGTGRPGKLEKIDVESGLALTRGEFRIKNKPIAEIMRQVSRWYDADVRFKDSVPGNYTLTASKQGSVDKVLKSLEETGSVHFDVQGRTITVSSR